MRSESVPAEQENTPRKNLSVKVGLVVGILLVIGVATAHVRGTAGSVGTQSAVETTRTKQDSCSSERRSCLRSPCCPGLTCTQALRYGQMTDMCLPVLEKDQLKRDEEEPKKKAIEAPLAKPDDCVGERYSCLAGPCCPGLRCTYVRRYGQMCIPMLEKDELKRDEEPSKKKTVEAPLTKQDTCVGERYSCLAGPCCSGLSCVYVRRYGKMCIPSLEKEKLKVDEDQPKKIEKPEPDYCGGMQPGFPCGIGPNVPPMYQCCPPLSCNLATSRCM